MRKLRPRAVYSCVDSEIHADAERRKRAAIASKGLAIDEIKSQPGWLRKERPQTTDIREDFLKEVASEGGPHSLQKWVRLRRAGRAGDALKALRAKDPEGSPEGEGPRVGCGWVGGQAGGWAVTEPKA